MSRNVFDVGRRALHIAITNDTASLPLARLGLTTRRTIYGPGSIAQHVWRRSAGFNHAGAASIPFSRPRSTTAEVGRVGVGIASRSRLRPWAVPSSHTKPLLQRRWKSDHHSTPPEKASQPPRTLPEKPPQPEERVSTSPITGGSSNKHLLNRLPHLHRPTKEELLAAATGFWHRLQIRFKWFSIRSVRPYTFDEIFAFVSWIFWAHLLWFIIGTTTFVSLAIWAINTVFAQETLAGWVGRSLTRNTGIKVVFESAIVPHWGDGVIRLNKVFVSRRPQTGSSQRYAAVSKGSSTTAAAAAAAEALAEKERLQDKKVNEEQEDDGNYTQFDVTIDTVEITLSFTKWFNGKGLLRDVEIRGVRGVLDRTSVQPRIDDVDPKSYRHEHNTGDFEIDNFKMEDVLLTVYQPNNFRPFQVSVFNCELPRLRKQWLFYDFMSANNMSGSFDNSLFTIHPRQVHSTTGVTLVHGSEEEASQWKKHSRIRLDGLKIDHLNRGVEGPFSWIYEGNVDIVADLMIPTDADGSIAKVMSDFYDRMEATVTAQTHHGLHRQVNHREDKRSSSSEARSTPANQHTEEEEEEEPRFLVMDIQIHLNDVRASVPLFTRDLSYVNNAAVRPIVAYINSHSHRSSNFIPISCRIVKRQSEFDGSWTVFDSGLLDDLSRETYEAFANDLRDEGRRSRRMRKVGIWAAQVAARALFLGLAGQLA